MTAYELVRTECANHLPNGRCLGILIRDNLSMTTDATLAGKDCRVGRGMGCGYFASTVMPTRHWTTDKEQQKRWNDGAAAFRCQQEAVNAPRKARKRQNRTAQSTPKTQEGLLL